MQTAEGTLHLKLSQVRECLDPFESLWVKSLLRRSDKLAGLIPQLYITGSSRDIEAALSQVLQVEGVSKSTVSALCRSLQAEFAHWQERDLSEHQIVYLFCDGIYLKLRPLDQRALAALCAYGIRANGKKVLLHLAVRDKESAVCWKSFFDGMMGRGLNEPLLVVIDGNSGVAEQCGRVFRVPGYSADRCIGCGTFSVADAESAARVEAADCQGVSGCQLRGWSAAGASDYRPVPGADYPQAMKCLRTDLEEVLTALRFPEAHRVWIRSTNLLKRLFGEGQWRSKVIPYFLNERSGMSLLFAVLVDASASWRGLAMTPVVMHHLQALNKQSQPCGAAMPMAA